MSTLTREQLQILVTKAALDDAFRAQLKTAPRDAVKQMIELDDDDITILATLTNDLERFLKSPIDPIDAKSWSIGICHIRK